MPSFRSWRRRNANKSRLPLTSFANGPEKLEERMLLAGDLVSQWRADSLNDAMPEGGNVSAWTDDIGGLAAIATGTPELVPLAIGGRSAIRLQPDVGGPDYFRILAADSPLTNAADFSVALVFQTSSTDLTGGTDEWFKNTGLVDSNQFGIGPDWGLSINQAGQLGTGMSAGFLMPTRSVYSTPTNLNDGLQHVAIVTRSGSTLSLYVDDQPADTITNADDKERGPVDLTFGILQTGSLPFTGDIAEVRIFDGALDASEVSALQSELSAYYGNTAPTAVDDSYTAQEDALLFLVPTATGVLQNDIDADGDAITATIVQNTANGNVTLNLDGSFIYDSNADFFGTDTFTYRTDDFRPGSVATVTIEVQPVYDGPRTQADSYKARPGEPIVVDAVAGVLSNDENPDQATLTAILETDVANGSLTLRPDGSFDYDAQGFTGRTSFRYQVDDGTRLSSPVTVSLAVTTPPEAQNDTFDVTEDTLFTATAAGGVLANDTDAENDTLTVRLVDDVANGQLALQPDGSFLYTPVKDYNGPDAFTYLANDGEDDSQLATVQLNVSSVNDPASAVADAYFVLPGTALAIDAQRGLLANDSDVDGPSLAAVLAAAPANGTAEISADGSFNYTPNAGFEGTDSFTYVVDDSIDKTDEVTVSVAVLSQPFVINEFMASNLDTISTRTRAAVEDRFRGTKEAYDWLEIRSLLPYDMDIGGLHLTDDADNLTKWAFPDGTNLPANGFLTLFASGLDVTDTELDSEGLMHTNFRIGRNGGYLALTNTDGTVLHDFGDAYPKQFPDLSYGLTPDGPRYLTEPTLGLENVDGTFGAVDSPTIDADHGFFTEPFQVTITNADPTATLYYTLDGSTPTSDSPVYTGPITVDGTTVLRAGALKDGFLPSRVDTRSYVFLADVVTQSLDGQPPEGWPAQWGANATDYGMDPDIVNDDEWGPQMEEALTQIPTMSIVTDLDNLFDRRTGIYARPSSEGAKWERPASLELVNPDGSTGFQTNIGVRIRGGFSRSTGNPKHAFRLFFDSTQGEGRLNFPLFGDEGADSFVKVDLRTTQNYSWAFQNDNRNTFLRDIYSRDLQGAMGHQYTRGRYYHLYINGQYFGIYQTEERPEANFAASYYGGDADDYDVVHNDPRNNGATNGNLDAYVRLWERFVQDDGLSDANMEDYYRVQGMNPDGSRNPEYERLLDVDSVIDYMIITYYTSDADGPGSKFTRPGLNNYFTIFNREDPDGFQFFEHDSEHSLDTGNAAGANYNMVSPLVNNGTRFNTFNPHWMHEQLANTNSDYLQRFQDRVNELFADDGLLGDDTVISMLRGRASQIDKAIIAESARWGDAKRSRPFTKTDWDRAVNNVVRWVTSRARGEGRREEVLSQFRRGSIGWWNDVVPPTFSQKGGRVQPGFQLSVTGTDGTIYYTANGADPRQSAGGVNPDAVAINSGDAISIDSGGFVNARILKDGEWSPITAAEFFVEPDADASNFRVSEINYNPSDPTADEIAAGFDNNEDFEFIELVNISNGTIDLRSAKLTQVEVDGGQEGVSFDFADSSLFQLRPGQRIVVVEDLAAFAFRYGNNVPVAGQWSGKLSNSAETITMEGAGDSIHQFRYADEWFPATDGGGATLEIIDASSSDLAGWNIPTNWRASATPSGTPGGSSRVPGDANGDGVFDSSDFTLVFQAGEYEDGVKGNSTFEEGDWDGDGDFTSNDLIFALQAGNFADPSPANRTEMPPIGSALADDDNLNRRDRLFGDSDLDDLHDDLDSDLLDALVA